MLQPRIEIIPQPFDRTLDRVAALLLLALWALSALAFTRLPATIPIHFDTAGQPNGYGSRATLFILPAIGSLMFLLLGAINTAPHIFNYPVKITPENAARQYTRAARFMRWMRLSILTTFLIVVTYTWHAATDGNTDHGGWLIGSILLVTFVPLIIYLVIATQKTKPSTEQPGGAPEP